MDVREEGYWKQFERSGRIEDYLSFVSKAGERKGTGQVKEEDHAGIYMGYGNHFEAVPGGRVR